MELLRIHILADKEIANHHMNNHWSKHVMSMPKLGFQFKGVWIGSAPESKN